jgi:NADPH-dependent glutamate synthase beta subunit-like oxidoreductase/NAD-dependent dihydropyrimidine dehydrogenase PreA subunit
MKHLKNRLHSVLVVGATPAGVAAVNKLGEMGLPVILVDRDPDLNAKLADEAYRLHSGVPFNFGHRPGLIRILRNPAIRLVMPGHVTGAKHNQQGFSVKIRQDQTFVDPRRCTLCGRCVEICPVGDGEKPISFLNRFALPGRAVIDKRRTPLCQENCPLGVNAQGYIALVKAGRYAEALALVKRDNVLPGICGRVCHHPCESACRRSDVDDPLAIRDIKRFLSDFELQNAPMESPAPAQIRTHSIAVVGSGPAGLAAAADLARLGYPVTVLEKETEAGGLLRYGIGPHRLPRNIVKREIDAVKALGVTFKTSHAVDLSGNLSEMRKEFASVILAVGSWADRKLGVPGEALDGVEGCLSFLHRFHRGEVTELRESVAVIGDGNAAFDLARILHRIGAKVTLISWFPKEMIPADTEEVKAAEAEGISIIESRQVTAFVEAYGRVESLQLMPTRPGKPGGDGIAWPVIIQEGSASTLKVDRAFVAIGQQGAFLDQLEAGMVDSRGFIHVDAQGRTPLPGVYAAGDAATGASAVVKAMASGRQVAARVHEDLSGQTASAGIQPATVRPLERDLTEIDPDLTRRPRTPMREIGKKAAAGLGFPEVALGYNTDEAMAEASRCLQCARCSECLECVKACAENQAVHHEETARESTENVGVLILADPEMGPDIQGEDVIRAYGPKAAKPDINAMILRGYAAAAKTMTLLKDTANRPKGYGVSFIPPDPGLADRVRMGVFVCRCNDSLGWMPEMDAYLQNLLQRPDMVWSESISSACIPEGIAHILSVVRQKEITRLVLASCVCCPLNFICSACTDQRSRLKEGLFKGTGISRSMVQAINLRGEVLQRVKHNPALAINQFVGLMERSIVHAMNLLSSPAPARSYNFTTAVIGRGEAAITAAVTLAEFGLEVYLFGTGSDPLHHVPVHPNIHAFTGMAVSAISGTIGNFKVRTQTVDGERIFTVGGIILGENTRRITLYRPHEAHPGYTVHATTQKSGTEEIPFMYPGSTSISGLFLADPPEIQISKRTKGAAAAVLAAAVMPRGPRQNRGYSVKINQHLCRGCGRCVASCTYQAIAFKPGAQGGYYAEVDDALCKGCGNCISVCPSDAADSPFRDHVYMEETVDRLLAGGQALS